ncbi:MAG: phosphate ABC transporter, permease protein PstA [Planctomycetes bacterium GWF2_42_9]|nr:MAG: phosphate ABC transporter, permease protein PstA [Planctomycetes bacterium GWF2_42_9]HAL45540.1 phosphate ABC transporter permease PtsA [Phycisphaerales bacterium]
MRVELRCCLDKFFTALTWLIIFAIIIVLLLILGPILSKGTSAVLFTDTVEFRKMQVALFSRGNEKQLFAEKNQTAAARQKVYDAIDNFKNGIDTKALTEKVRNLYRRCGQELRAKNLSNQQYTEIRAILKDIRDRLEIAFASNDKNKILENIGYVIQYRQDERFNGTSAHEFFTIAENFSKSVENTDLAKLSEYTKELQEVENLLTQLFGPRPGLPSAATAINQFGATRLDLAQSLLDKILWKEQWVTKENQKSLVKTRTSRSQGFAGTQIEPIFEYLKNDLDKMMLPKFKFYWQYFIDDSTPGHYFGGIGPEILGTLLLTLLSMVFVIPLGVISAAYLTEFSSDNLIIKIIRICINSLAGVPSIIFGLFGLAFFVLFLLPAFGFASKPCILTASMTLSILTLPVMIRSSEEAIKAVPATYKEASLALGAGKFKTFILVTLPAALPGILTGVILSLSRVAGETAPILFTGAVALGPVPRSIFDSTRTLSYGSYDMAVGDRLAMMVPHNQYGMVASLILLVLCLNAMAIILRTKLFKRLHGH